MDSDPEVVRRLVLLDRKLNYISVLAIAGAVLAIGVIVFFLVRSEWGDIAALICAAVAASAVGRYEERLFRRADP
jgi:uncharacterized membrane protein (DUF373 family)